MYDGCVALSAHCRSGYIDEARSLEIMLRSLVNESNEKMQEDECLMNLKTLLLKYCEGRITL